MSKKLILKLSKNQLISSESKKAFIEKSYYLSKLIEKCSIKKFNIFFFLNQKIKYQDKIKLKKQTQKLILIIESFYKEIETVILYENKIKAQKGKKTFQKLKKSKQIKQISPGIYTIQGAFLKNFEQLDYFLDKYAKIERYKNIAAHNILPIKSLFANGYLSNFAHHAILCSHVERNIISIDQISNLKLLDKNFIKKKLNHPDLILSPTVCYHCFETLKKKKINKNIIFNIKASCNRYESKNFRTFERLQSFTMREYVAFGTKKFTDIFLKKNLNYFKKIFINLNIKFRIASASDSFFSDQGMKKILYQNINSLKQEFQFWLPDEKKWLAVGSFNNHLQSLTSKYNITNTHKKNIYSACIGWGYERFIYSFLAQGLLFKKM
jgi:seryl-tRNA synthetase